MYLKFKVILQDSFLNCEKIKLIISTKDMCSAKTSQVLYFKILYYHSQNDPDMILKSYVKIF